MDTNNKTVQWTLDHDGDLAIYTQGKWYGFLMKHPSEIREDAYEYGFDDMFIPFDDTDNSLVNDLRTKKLETYTDTRGY